MLIELIIVTILLGVYLPRPKPFDFIGKVWAILLALLWLLQVTSVFTAPLFRR